MNVVYGFSLQYLMENAMCAAKRRDSQNSVPNYFVTNITTN